jgi:hypothetical protein
MKGIALSCLQKSLVNSKAFGVRRLRTYYFNIILKGEFLKKLIAGRPFPNLDLSNYTTFSPF